MSWSGDYEEEMGTLDKLSDVDIERLFAGKAPLGEDGLGELARDLRVFKEARLKPASEVTEARHVTAIVKTSRLLGHTPDLAAGPSSNGHGPELDAPALSEHRRKGMFSNRLVSLTAAALGAMTLTAGLAFAGVNLPAPAQAVFESLGLDLPNQTDEARVPEDAGKPETTGNEISQFATTHSPKGCEFGQAVAQMAQALRSTEVRKDAAHTEQRPDPCEQADEQADRQEAPGSRATGEERSAQGRATAQQNSSVGREASSEGRSTAATASSSGQSVGAQASAEGTNTAGSASGGRSTAGRSTGNSAAESGQSRNPLNP